MRFVSITTTVAPPQRFGGKVIRLPFCHRPPSSDGDLPVGHRHLQGLTVFVGPEPDVEHFAGQVHPQLRYELLSHTPLMLELVAPPNHQNELLELLGGLTLDRLLLLLLARGELLDEVFEQMALHDWASLMPLYGPA